MSDADPQLVLLQLAERLAYERFKRLNAASGMADHPEIVEAARDVWDEAAATMRAHERKSRPVRNGQNRL